MYLKYKKTDLQLEKTVTNTLIPVLDVEPRGLSDLISSRRACCAVWLREGGMGERGEEWREITTVVLVKSWDHKDVWLPQVEGRNDHN